MLEPRGIGILILFSIVGLTDAQTTDRSCASNSVCENGATICLDRPLAPSAADTEVNYVCDCSAVQFVGFDCDTISPGHRRDMDGLGFQTCYGNECRTGSFESLNYPDLYIDRWTAVYLLYIPNALRITFTFDDTTFGIESFKDELYVGTGLTPSVSDFTGADIITSDREVRFFDNTTLNGATQPPPFSFNSDTAWFYFLTDKNIQFTGWRIFWEADVDDQGPVVVGCPSNVQRTLERGEPPFFSITWTEPVGNDVSPPVTFTSTHNSGDNFFVGTTTVTYTFFDRFQNPTICSFDVTIIEADTTPPTISNCPEDIPRVVELGTMEISVSWTEPTATDVGPVTLVQRSHMPGANFPAPDTTTETTSTTVFYIFSDDNQNSATCSFTVTVSAVDTIAPTIMNCPADIFDTVEVGPIEIASITWVEPTATDISGTERLESRSHAPGFGFPVGSTPVTYTFVDDSGNSASCSFNVLIQRVDTIPPTVINCPTVVSETVELGQPGIQVTWTEPTATDASEPPPVVVVRTRNPGDFFPVGDTEVTYTFTDSSSNSAMCTFTVRVSTQDTTPPTITSCPPDQTQTIELGTPPPVIFWTQPTATDNSGIADIVSQSHESGNTFTIGTTQVTYIFQDPSGNSAVCSFNVEVTTVDTTPPTIAGCPSDITEMVELGIQTLPIFWVEPTATDASGTAQISSRSHAPGTDFPADQPTVVTYEFSDISGNSATCTFTVFVLSVDNTPPVCVNNPADIIERIELGTPGTTVTWNAPTCNDVSGTAIVTDRSNTSPSFFAADTTTVVSHTCTDQSGNTGSCSFTVFVQTVDTTPPVVVQGPDPITQIIELGDGGSVINWQDLTVTDISNTQTLISRSHEPGSFFAVGNTLVTYVYGDESGNTVTYTFCVTVQEVDTVPPVISNCPQQPITVVIELGLTTGVAFWGEPSATDLSGVATLSSRSAAPGDDFMIGQTAVVYTYVDGSNNMATCVFTVNVETVDTIPPTITGCPTVVMETVELGVTSTFVFFTEPTATDASGVAQVMRSHTPGSSFPVGVTSITYTFTDASGNSDVCNFIVNVNTVDTTPPVCAGLPQDIIEQVELGTPGTVVTWTLPSCTDNGVAMISGSSHNPNTFFMVDPVGTEVTYTCTDEAGLSTDCSFIVRVVTIDTTPPMCGNVPVNPSSTVELATTGIATVTWTPPTCIDLSPTQQTSTHMPGAVFPVGMTEVTYTCVDSSQNSFSCSFTVNVFEVDTTPPTCINLPQDITEIIELGTPLASVNWIEPTCSDASGTPTRTANRNPGESFTVGVTTVTYTCIDSSNNVGTCSFEITVATEDTVPPTIMGCPAPGSVSSVVELGIPETVVFWAEPTATDISGVATITLRSHQPGSSFPVGTTDVTYIFTDGSGNAATCVFPVTVTTIDTTPPTISNCPTEASTVVELGSTTGSVFWTDPTATDLSGVAVLSERSHSPGAQFPLGQTPVTITFTDASDNSAVCQFTVSVTTVDTTMPVISNCPTGASEVVELGTPGAVVTWTEPSATDISGQVTLSSRSIAPGSFFVVGSEQVQYIFVDPSGNEAVCTFTVTVTTIDTTPPTCVNLPPNGVSEVVELGLPGRTVTFDAITCNDISMVAFVTSSSHMPGAFFPVGDTTVTYTCTDGSGNSDQCSFTVTVTEEDTTPPQCASQPPDVFETIELGQSQRVVSWIPPTCNDLSPTSSFSSANPGDFFPVGQTEVTFTCIDSSGNSGTCSFTVNVNEVDTTPPVCVGLPPGASGTAEIGGVPGTTISWVAPTCSDLSATTITSSASPGDFFSVGSTTVVYTCTDSANNVGTCMFDVTVTFIDTTPPECTNLPADITRFVELGLPGDNGVTWVEPICTDASGSGRILTSTSSPLDFFPVGTTTVTYTCTDDASLTTSCSFDVVIQTRDTVPPTISNCPEDQLLTVELGTPSARAFWTTPTATDISGVANIETNTHSPGDLFSIGMTTVMYIFVDASNNRATCQFVITVDTEDTTPPTISNCPDVITNQIELGTPGAIIEWTEPTATDISGVVSITSRSHAPSSLFMTGSTEVSYIFTDINGNSAICSFMVIITEIDTTPPTIQNCPADMGVTIELGTPGTSVTWIEPSATDLSGTASLQSQSHTPSSFFIVGDTLVTYTYVDASGNTASCRFTVTVTPVDTTPPDPICPPDVEVVVELGTPGMSVDWPEPTATDISGTVRLVSRSATPGTFFQVGTQTITYIFTDDAGNTATCIFCVSVITVDTTPPTISNCPTSDVQATVEFGTPGTTVSWLEPTATDISGTAILQSASDRPNDFFPVGRTLVTYEFIDQSLNSNSCTFFVNIVEVDTIPPTCIGLPADMFEVIELGEPGITLTWIEPTCQDLDTASVTQRSATSPTFFEADSVTDVTFTCTDLTGNVGTCDFTVTVNTQDTTPPVITSCPTNINRVIELGLSGTVITWSEPTAIDISGIVNIQSQSHQSGSFFSVGTTTVTYTLTDPSFNSVDCTFVVTVTTEDTTPPTISNCPQSNVEQTVELGTPNTLVFYQEPTATDLASPVTVTSTCSNGDLYPVGETTCIYTFADPSGNTDTCIFLIVIETVDTTPPTVTCPEDVTMMLELGTPGTIATWPEPTATDISGIVVLQSQSHTSGSFFTEEKTTITYTFADASGNTASCSFCVTLEFEDTTPPECVNVPSPPPEIIELGTPGTLVSWQAPSCTDISGVAFVSASSHQPGAFFPVGTTPVTYTCTDGAGLSTICPFTVTVTEVDTIPPDITCPADVPITVEILTGGAIATWVVPTATDISGMVTVTSVNSPGTFFLTGVTPVTYTAIDSSGNVNSCTFNVEIIEVDTMPPVVMCPDDVTQVIEINTGPVAVNFPLPTATDNSGQVPILISQSHQPGDFFNDGLTTVTYTFSDMAGNSMSCSFTVDVIIVDTMDPIISGCPPDVTEETTLELRTCPATWQDPVVSDNSGTVSLFSQSHQSGTLFNEGTTVVTYTYTDPAGNQASCSFTVTCNPVDRVNPIVVCPADVMVETSLEIPFCMATWNEPQASDNSGTVTLVTQSHQSGVSQFPAEVDTTVTYTYTDPSGNQASCDFTVTCTPVDRVDPIVICPPDTPVTIIEGLSGTNVFFNQPTVSDNSGLVPTVILSQDSNSFFPVGTTTVQITVRDPSGNQAECTFDVIVTVGNPCDPNPCENGGFCAIDSLTMFTCVCSECFTGDTCNIAIDACSNNLCQNGAACVAAEGACDVYTCECPPCYSGEFCEDFRDACENHQCQGGATCCAGDDCLTYSCQCPPCFDGTFCENAINPCENHQCQNSAQCVPDILGDCSGYTCQCTGCFTGRFCNQPFNPCQPNPCQNNGFCSPDAADCYRFTCQCQGCFTGTQCEIPIPNPCQPNPCSNGGTCSRVGTSCSSYTCECPKGFLGIDCELIQTDNSNPCNSFPCENGASCVESGTSYICMCITGFAGINCAQAISSQPLLQAQLACNSNPCMNGATCINSFNSLSNNFVYEPQYSCMCSNSFTGTNCQDFINLGLSFCTPGNPCTNGGSCTNAYHSFRNEVDYVCRCQVGFRGKDCESDVGNPCNSSPCQNSGTCIPFNTYFTCSCPTTFSGQFCQTPVGSGPQITVTNCPTNVNLNAQGATVTATWADPVAFGGVSQPFLLYQSHSSGDTFAVGETPVTYVFTDSSLRFAECTFFVIVTSTNRCSPNPCQNGGLCLQNGNTLCDCTGTGFTGNTCSQTIGPALTCPQDVSVTTAGSSAIATWQQPTAGNGLVFISSTSQSGQSFPLGQTIVTYNYINTNTGQQVSCSFTVTVSAIGPSLTCPADVSETTSGTSATVTWPDPTTNTNLFFISSTAQSGDSFPLGETEVMYNYFDLSTSQPVSCTFTVTVISAPVVVTPCPADITQFTNTARTSVTWTENNNGGTQFVVQRSHTSGSLFDLGITPVTLTYFDISVGQQLTCTFNINLIGSGITQPLADTTPPQFFTCPPDIRFNSLPAGAAGQSINLQWSEPTYDDEGGTVQLNQTHAPGDPFIVGEVTTVVYTITDTAGNSATCEFVVSLQIAGAGRKKRDVEFEGLFQRHDTMACPCQNGGECITMKDLGSFCACPAGYTGILCEVRTHDQMYASLNDHLPFVIIIGFLVIIICLLAITMLRITRRASKTRRTVRTDEVPIIN